MTISQDFLGELKKANAAFDKQKEGGFNYFNIFDALNLAYKENYHSAFIAYLLDKNAEHYQSVFVRRFLELLQSKMSGTNFPKNANLDTLKEVSTEKLTEAIKENRRMDIFLEFDEACIIIENKIYADDQKAQLKAYVDNANKTLEKRGFSEQERANRILFVYLHRDKDAMPSKTSLSTYEIRDKSIYYKNTRKAYFLKIDYKFIKEWLKSCLKELEKHAASKARGKTRGENGLNKIIFGVEQYCDILSWYINDEFEEKNAVVEFLTKDFLAQGKNAKFALEIYRDEKHKITDKETREIVANSWNEFCERIVGEFYKQVEARLSKFNINKAKFKCEIWETKKSGWHLFFKKEKDNYAISFGLAFALDGANFKKPYFAYAYAYNDETEKSQREINKILKECGKHFESVGRGSGILLNGYCYYQYLKCDESEKDYAFVRWVITQGENAVSEFIKGLKAFAENSVIGKTMQEIEAVLGENL